VIFHNISGLFGSRGLRAIHQHFPPVLALLLLANAGGKAVKEQRKDSAVISCCFAGNALANRSAAGNRPALRSSRGVTIKKNATHNKYVAARV
jgi:hypothetical protein